MYTKELERLLRKQKINRPFGIFLSGGIDSGLLAALLKPDFAITIRYPEGEKYDESKGAKKIAKHVGVKLKILEPKKKEFKRHLINAIKVMGKPVRFTGLTSLYLLMREVAGSNMVTGDGGDELFCGYSRCLILNHVYQLYKVPELENYHPMLDSVFGNIHSKLLKKPIPESKDIEGALRQEYLHNFPELLEMGRKLAKHFRIKLYQPFLNRSVVSFAKKLPLKCKIRGFETKWILRELARKYLPKEIANNPDKRGLPCPVNKWMGWEKYGEFNKKKYLEFQNARLRKTFILPKSKRKTKRQTSPKSEIPFEYDRLEPIWGETNDRFGYWV